MKQKEELEDSALQVNNMSFITSFLTTQVALQNSQMMLHHQHKRFEEEDEERRKKQQEEERKKQEEKEYVPKHAKKEDLEKEQVSM